MRQQPWKSKLPGYSSDRTQDHNSDEFLNFLPYSGKQERNNLKDENVSTSIQKYFKLRPYWYFFFPCKYWYNATEITHFFYGATTNSATGPPHCPGFTIISDTRINSVGLLWTSDQPRSRDLYLTTLNTHKWQTSMLPPAGFEPAIPANEWPQTHVLERAATETGCYLLVNGFQDAFTFL